MELNLTLPLPVSINKLYINQYSYNPKKRMRVPTGKRILSQQGRRVKNKIQAEARVQMEGQDWNYDWTKEGYVYQDATIYFNRKGRDDNNVYKLLNDSLEEITYDNDSRVLVRTQRILYDTENPRIELKLTPVEFIGIFDDQEELSNFEDNCMSCSRYLKGRCSILKESKEGKIREEITDDKTCEKYKEKKK